MFGLSDRDISSLRSVFSDWPDVKFIVYGSRARGDYHSSSDIDIALDGNVSISDVALLEERLDDLLLPYRIDLVRYNMLQNPALKQNIQTEGRLLITSGPIPHNR